MPAPDQREYVMVPIKGDRTEFVAEDGGEAVTVYLTDLSDEITVVTTPPETSVQNMQSMQDMLKERGGDRQFIIVQGGLPDGWEFMKLIARDKYDPILRERRTGS